MSQNLIKKSVETPVGKLTLIADEKSLKKVLWAGENDNEAVKGDNAVLQKAETQLAEYFAGKRKSFDLPISPQGTEFQKSAWAALSKIPYGKTRSYSEQAEKIGDVKKVRAVGNANGKNPLSIVVPCHRVIGKNGKLTGFRGGLKVKEFLLRHEVENQ